MKNAKHIVKTVLFCGTLAVFSAVSVFSPKEKGSFYENRRLAVFPVPSVETVLDGTFFSDVETYISDHFACRVPLLRLNVRKELALHNPVVPSIVDGVGNALGYSLVLLTVAAIRELFGAGSLFGVGLLPLVADGGWYQPLRLMLLAPSAFIILGLLVWAVRSLRRGQREAAAKALPAQSSQAVY